MSDIKPIQNNYVTVNQNLGVINHGDGYAIVNIYTGEYIARNITSFDDCLKAMITLVGLGRGDGETGGTEGEDKDNGNGGLEDAIRGLKPDIQRLIRKYAPETVSVDKSTNPFGQSRYKCFDDSGNVLGRVRGKTGDRYWQYGGLDGIRHY